MIPLLLALAACDDDIFPAPHVGEVVEGDSYEDVVTILDGSCTSCHGAASAVAGLDLETDPCAALVGVASPTYGEPLVAPGDHAASVIWHKMSDSGTYGGVMPSSGAIATTSVDTVAAWIDDGATCGGDTATTSLGAEP